MVRAKWEDHVANLGADVDELQTDIHGAKMKGTAHTTCFSRSRVELAEIKSNMNNRMGNFECHLDLLLHLRKTANRNQQGASRGACTYQKR